MDKQLKILVCGDVEGNFNLLFKKVASINKKAGPFDILFCLGNFFGDKNPQWPDYVSGETKVPVPTCVLGPNRPEHKKYFGEEEDGGDLAPNITYLGRRGLYVGSSGLNVAYLSGQDAARVTNNDVTFTSDDVNALMTSVTSSKGFKGVDILLTSSWTYGVEKYAKPVDGMAFDSKDCGSMAVSQLAIALRPRYHFVALEGAYYERQPYRNHQVLVEGAKHVTRFLALSNVGNTSKKKYLYAFNMVPLSHMESAELVKQPQDCTECPYTLDPSYINKDAMGEKVAQFFYDQDVLDGKKGGKGRGKRQHRGDRGGPDEKKKPQPQGPCWFCLGSPAVEKHLVVSVGTHTYMALAKGGLTDDHVMLLPIGHHQSIVAAPDDVIDEIDKYKTVLRKCFKAEGKVPIYFERNYKTSHLQIQVVPVPKKVLPELKETFDACAASHNIELAELPKHSDIRQIVASGSPYFYAELPTGDKLLHRIKGPFPLQFGREVLAHDTLLDLPFRVDWRNCKSSTEEETNAAREFKKLFAPYEFNSV